MTPVALSGGSHRRGMGESCPRSAQVVGVASGGSVRIAVPVGDRGVQVAANDCGGSAGGLGDPLDSGLPPGWIAGREDGNGLAGRGYPVEVGQTLSE